MRKPREKDEKFITIKEVAAEAGVSIATVSRVINNIKVKEARKKAVLDAIEKLDYVPNNNARSLASVNSTKKIKIVIPSGTLPSYNALIDGFRECAKIYKYDVMVESYGFDLSIYHKINKDSNNSGEVKGILQIGPYEDITGKIVVPITHDLIKYKVSEKYNDKKIGFYFEEDEYLADLFTQYVFTDHDIIDVSAVLDKELDMYIVQTIEQGARLVNLGVKGEVLVLDDVTEVSKLIPKLQTFNFDFYSIGATLARIMIKMLSNTLKEDEKEIVFKID